MLDFNTKIGEGALIERRRRVDDEPNDDDIEGTNGHRNQR